MGKIGESGIQRGLTEWKVLSSAGENCVYARGTVIAHSQYLELIHFFVQNVNTRGIIYSIWIILHKCERCCEARLDRKIGRRADLVGVQVLNYTKTGGQ